MGILKTRQNKKFNYVPRYYKGEGNPFQIKHKFDEHRKTVGNVGLKGKFENAWDDYKNAPDPSVNRRIFIIAAILIFLFLLLIGFDLSLFFPKG